QSEFHPLTTCGIGQNLFIRPDGGVYPCYAWCGEHTRIGNVFDAGLNALLRSPQFTRLAACTVDTIAKCRDCASRYLCGGACRAWGNRNALDPNAAPVQCDHLQQRAQSLIDAAKEYILHQKQ
ncbi:MAG: SPASM domain-containing protein, partial [Bacteroidales bacterium]|nr:SPASM domain-containing protein [Bacteroidales bacterium]